MTPISESDALVRVRDLTVEFRASAREFRRTRERVRAVDGVTIDVERRVTTALVGESGCGKTTLGRTILGLYEPARGEVVFDGARLSDLSSGQRKAFRRRAQMIFQDPYSSLNPRMKVSEIVAEPLRAHGIGSRADRRRRVRAVLDLVGLPEDAGQRFPNSFSGGQRQRVGIARALALEPDFIVADEPVSALDVSIQAQIVNLLRLVQRELGLTLLLIAHDLAVVRHVADNVAVMYLGRIVEFGTREAVFERPSHPYTQALLSVVPVPDPRVERTRRRVVLRGDVPSPISLPRGCRFHTRCPLAMDICKSVDPQLQTMSDGRLVACHLHTPDAVRSRRR